MHRKRTVLGGRSAIEVMTGRQPDNAVRMASWTGVRLKYARRGDIDMAMVDKYCERLEKAWRTFTNKCVTRVSNAAAGKQC